MGRLVAKKGHRDLIMACARLDQQGADFECRIIGEGPQRAELEQLIEANSLGERVKLLGARSKEQVLANLGSADVFALPVTIAPDGDRDGMPVALAEAMAMGLAVISTDIVGIRELVQPGTGILVRPNDPAAPQTHCDA